jgi:hypothetical protein
MRRIPANIIILIVSCAILPKFAEAANYRAWCGHGASNTCCGNETLYSGQPLDLIINGSVPCEDGPVCGGASFTATMKSNIFFGPTQVWDKWWVPAGIGVKRQATISTTCMLGTDQIVIEITSDQTGSTVLARCDFTLTILDPAPDNPTLISPTHSKGQPSCAQVMTVQWQKPWAPMGVAGYSYTIISQDDPNWIVNRSPDNSIDLDASVTSFTTQPLAPGHVWEFNIRTIDTQGRPANFYESFWVEIDSCSVNITSPRAGDVFRVGDFVNVYWQPVTYGGNDVSGGYDVASIDLMLGLGFVRNLVANQPNFLSSFFVVPDVNPWSNYNLRIVLGRNSAGDMFPYLPKTMIGFSNYFSITKPLSKADVNGDGLVNCNDVAIVKASFGKRSGQPGFDARADVNKDGIVDVRDLAFVSQNLPAGTRCH